jgi:hypothetical protein
MKCSTLVTLNLVTALVILSWGAPTQANWSTLPSDWTKSHASLLLSIKDEKKGDKGHHHKNAKHHDGKKHGDREQADEPVENSDTPSPPPAPAGQVGDCNVLIGDYCQ